MPQNEPEDPISTLLEGAASLHELYSSYVEAGFTKEQAMQLTCAMLQEFIRNNPSLEKKQ